jgi:molybdopterin-containing oxidoreductase family iron-sulfur binding subunit
MEKTTRRRFLGLAGLAAAGAGLGPALRALAARPPGAAFAAPLTARQWAMVIDTRKCLKKDGCTICIDACHAIHNVPRHAEARHEVKWVWKDRFEHALPDQAHEYMIEGLKGRNVLLLCNHCANPSCVRVCPTKATWKRASDGIVMMDMHRCVGCRFCMAACPYGSRSFNWVDPRKAIAKVDPGYPTRTRGVVEKCTFCVERLVRGQGPKCVEVCPEKALAFGDVEDAGSEVRALLASRFNLRRKPNLGTRPEVYYLV